MIKLRNDDREDSDGGILDCYPILIQCMIYSINGVRIEDEIWICRMQFLPNLSLLIFQ